MFSVITSFLGPGSCTGTFCLGIEMKPIYGFISTLYASGSAEVAKDSFLRVTSPGNPNLTPASAQFVVHPEQDRILSKSTSSY